MDPKKLLFEHGEKLGLGLAALILFLYLLFTFLLKPADTEVKEIDRLKGEVTELLNRNKPPPQEGKDYVRMAQEPWEVVSKPGEAFDWTMYYKTTIEEVPTGTLDVAPVEEKHHHKAVTLKPTQVEIGKVTLRWTKSKETDATIDGYLVFRKEPSGEFKQIAKPELQSAEGAVTDEQSYEDPEIQPKRTYVYRIVSVTKDDKCEVKETTSNEESATTTSTVRVALKGGSADEKNKIATITVSKYFSETKSWEDRPYTVRPGEPIGKEERRSGPEGKPIKLDFRTGYTLVDVKQETRTEKVKKKRRVVKEGVGQDEEYEETVSKTMLKMVYKDDEGKPQELWQEEAEKRPSPPAGGAPGAGGAVPAAGAGGKPKK